MEAQPPLKRCSKCRHKRPLHCFSKSRAMSDGLDHYCRPCRRAQVRHSKTGCSAAEYQRLLKRQGGRCAICRRLPEEDGEKSLCADHDHETKTVRGLLCQTCNLLLGKAREHPGILRAAIRYLARFQVQDAGEHLEPVEPLSL